MAMKKLFPLFLVFSLFFIGGKTIDCLNKNYCGHENLEGTCTTNCDCDGPRTCNGLGRCEGAGGRRFIYADNYDTAKIGYFDIDNDQNLGAFNFNLNENHVESLEFSPDNTKVVTCGSTKDDKGFVKVFQDTGGDAIYSVSIGDYSMGCKFSLDGKSIFFTASEDNYKNYYLYGADIETSNTFLRFKVPEWSSQLTWVGNGKYLAMIVSDTSVVFFNPETQTIVKTIPLGNNYGYFTVTKDLRTLFAIRINFLFSWDISGDAPLLRWQQTTNHFMNEGLSLSKKEDLIAVSGTSISLQIRSAETGALITTKTYTKREGGPVSFNFDDTAIFFGGRGGISLVRVTDLEIIKTFVPANPIIGIKLLTFSNCCSIPERDNICSACKLNPGFYFKDNVCKECPSNCYDCSSQRKCSSCKNPTLL